MTNPTPHERSIAWAARACEANTRIRAFTKGGAAFTQSDLDSVMPQLVAARTANIERAKKEGAAEKI